MPKTREVGHYSFSSQCIIQTSQPVKTSWSVLFCCAGEVAYGWSDCIILLNNAENQHSDTEGWRRKDAMGALQKKHTWTVHITQVLSPQSNVDI